MNTMNRERTYSTEVCNLLSPFEYKYSSELQIISDSISDTSEKNVAYNSLIENYRLTALDKFAAYQGDFGLNNRDLLNLDIGLDRPLASKIVNKARLAPMYVLPIIVHKFFGISVDELVFGTRSRILLTPELTSVCRMLDEISDDSEKINHLYALADKLCDEYDSHLRLIISSQDELTAFTLERIAKLVDIYGVSLRCVCNVQPYIEGLSYRLHIKNEIYKTEYVSLKRFLPLVFRWGQSLDYFCSTSAMVNLPRLQIRTFFVSSVCMLVLKRMTDLNFSQNSALHSIDNLGQADSCSSAWSFSRFFLTLLGYAIAQIFARWQNLSAGSYFIANWQSHSGSSRF